MKVYNDSTIREAKAAKRKSNDIIAKNKKMGVATVSKICNGATNVELESLIKVADELDYTVEIVFRPKSQAA